MEVHRADARSLRSAVQERYVVAPGPALPEALLIEDRREYAPLPVEGLSATWERCAVLLAGPPRRRPGVWAGEDGSS